MASKSVQSSAIKALQKELIELNTTPVEGFKVNPSAVENMFIWDVAVFGPPLTLYEGGYFKARLVFPPDYPYNPPSMQFLSKMFHPNIYDNGQVCISILHSPGEDPQSGELASERWNPTQNVRTILLSVISLLNEPNIHSAAHVEASVSYRRWKESNGADDEYLKIVRGLVHQTISDAERDGVHVPITLEEYCVSGRPANVSPDENSDGERPSSDFDDNYEFYTSDGEDEDYEPTTGSEVDKDNATNQSAGSSTQTVLNSGRVATDTGVDSAMEETDVGDPPQSGRKHNLHHHRSLLDETRPGVSQSNQGDTSLPHR